MPISKFAHLMSSKTDATFISIRPFLPGPNSKCFRLKKTNQPKSELTDIAQQHLYEDVLKSKTQTLQEKSNRQPNSMGRRRVHHGANQEKGNG